jgi:hypothetical protein
MSVAVPVLRAHAAHVRGRGVPAHPRRAEQTFGKEHVERKIREPRRPRQRGSVSDGSALAANSESCALAASSDSSAVAASGLVNMGFRRAEVQRALDAVRGRHRPEELSTIPVHAILREARAVLTQGTEHVAAARVLTG